MLPGLLAFAQSPTGATTSPAPATKAAAVRSEASPTWKSLTPVQREALAPLASVWGEIGSNRKRKWIALSANFSALSPQDKATLHGRMKEWASLSSTQRNQVRLNFALSRDLSHEEKKAHWEAYQALSPEQKKQLAAQAKSQTTGAAPAVTKGKSGKLAVVPVTRSEAPATLGAAQRAKAPASAAAPVQKTSGPLQSATSAAHAPGITPSLMRRMACWLYEGMLLFGVVFIAGYLFGTLSQTRNALDNRHALQAFLFVVFGIYFTWFWARGQTLAMKTWDIALVDVAGRPVTQARALMRYLLSWAWILPPLAAVAPFGLTGAETFVIISGWVVVWALLSRFQPQQQFWHDALAGTRLVSRPRVPRR